MIFLIFFQIFMSYELMGRHRLDKLTVPGPYAPRAMHGPAAEPTGQHDMTRPDYLAVLGPIVLVLVPSI